MPVQIVHEGDTVQIVPAPLVSISTQLLKNGAGEAFGVTYSITLTGTILDDLAEEFSQLQVIHIETLPSGWLGKLNALNIGTQCANGELLLYADADVHFEPDFMKRVVAHFENDQLDYLTLFPEITAQSWRWCISLSNDI